MGIALLPLLLIGAVRVESKFEQVSPEPPPGKLMGRWPGQKRAIVLIHGLHVHPFSKDNVLKPLMRDWQKRDSKLVHELGGAGDIYAFAYAQDVQVDEVASGSSLGDDIRALRAQGYTEIVLIGHSAGGLIARQFVEDHPDAGVTRVIQVCAPNGGSSWAKLPAVVRKNQMVFLHSLTKEGRRLALDWRRDRQIPENVEFICVVGAGKKSGDGVVSREAQWPEDLQRQGIPVVMLDVTHPTAMRSQKSAEVIAKLAVTEVGRWQPEQVMAAKKVLFAN
jgi:pimeloyl-ACP methyl ester carboxylesterase